MAANVEVGQGVQRGVGSGRKKTGTEKIDSSLQRVKTGNQRREGLFKKVSTLIFMCLY